MFRYLTDDLKVTNSLGYHSDSTNGKLFTIKSKFLISKGSLLLVYNTIKIKSLLEN